MFHDDNDLIINHFRFPRAVLLEVCAELCPALECDAARSHAFAFSLSSAYHTGLLDNRGSPEEPVRIGQVHPYVSQVYEVLI